MVGKVVLRTIVICAVIGPSCHAQQGAQDGEMDHFVELFVDTPLEVYEQRDVKEFTPRRAERKSRV